MITGGVQGDINIEFSADFGDGSSEIIDLGRTELIDYVNGIMGRYTVADEIICIDVYLKKFSTQYIGRSLVFCNIALSTPYGIVSEHGSGWSIKKAVKNALVAALASMEKAAEYSIAGKYTEAEEYVEA